MFTSTVLYPILSQLNAIECVVVFAQNALCSLADPGREKPIVFSISLKRPCNPNHYGLDARSFQMAITYEIATLSSHQKVPDHPLIFRNIYIAIQSIII